MQCLYRSCITDYPFWANGKFYEKLKFLAPVDTQILFFIVLNLIIFFPAEKIIFVQVHCIIFKLLLYIYYSVSSRKTLSEWHELAGYSTTYLFISPFGNRPFLLEQEHFPCNISDQGMCLPIIWHVIWLHWRYKKHIKLMGSVWMITEKIKKNKFERPITLKESEPEVSWKLDFNQITSNHKSFTQYIQAKAVFFFFFFSCVCYKRSSKVRRSALFVERELVQSLGITELTL